jgi:hypothetical protein
MFVKEEWESLAKKNTLASYKNPKFTDKKRFITLGQVSIL